MAPMNIKPWAAGALLAFALLGSAVAGTSGAPDVAEIDRLIKKNVQERHLVGLSVGVMHQGRIVLAKGYGVRSLETREPVTPETLFAAGYEPKRNEPGLAEGYTFFGLGEPQPAVPEGEGWLAAAAALWSTPRDLLAWDLALMDGKILSEASWRARTRWPVTSVASARPIDQHPRKRTKAAQSPAIRAAGHGRMISRAICSAGRTSRGDPECRRAPIAT